MFRKNHKNFKAIGAVLGHSEFKIFSVGQPWRPTFFGDVALPHPAPPPPPFALPQLL